MNLSLLIVGKDKEDRAQKAAEFVSSRFDWLTLDEAGIEEIRTINDFLSRRPTQGEVNVCLINEVQNLSVEAQNALLKTLEEPRESARVILTAPNSFSLLPTVVSRCLTIDLGTPETKIKDKAKVTELVKNLLEGNLSTRISKGAEIEIDEFLLFWRDILLNKSQQKESEFKELTSNQILDYLEKIIETKKRLAANVNQRLALEVLAIEAPKETARKIA